MSFLSPAPPMFLEAYSECLERSWISSLIAANLASTCSGWRPLMKVSTICIVCYWIYLYFAVAGSYALSSPRNPLSRSNC